MMTTALERHDARTVPTKFIEANGRRLAYRMFGDGPPLVLCLRLRGVMDVWDPAFLDALARNFTVITFDYSGVGQSTGHPSYQKKPMAADVKDLIDALGFDKIVVGGWSLGGIAAMTFTALYPERVSHVVAIASLPPGIPVKAAEPLFFETALKPDYTAEDEYILFFEPKSAASRAAGDASMGRIASRTGDLSPPIAPETYMQMLKEASDPSSPYPDPDGIYSDLFQSTSIPVLALCADHDIVFPVENWYALNGRWPTLTIVTYPSAGHGPQHQKPEMSADIIASFVRNT